LIEKFIKLANTSLYSVLLGGNIRLKLLVL